MDNFLFYVVGNVEFVSSMSLYSLVPPVMVGMRLLPGSLVIILENVWSFQFNYILIAILTSGDI